MRIRKNANLSSLGFSNGYGAEGLQIHVCQLNQSPWDAIPFTQETYSACGYQFEGECSLNGNESLGDSVCADESSMSIMEDTEEKSMVNNMVIDNNYNYGNTKKRALENQFKFKKGEKVNCCNKSDGKGWHCKNESKPGHSMFDHHLSLLKCNANANNDSAVMPKSEKAKRDKVKGKKGSSGGSNPYEFYYYSGFGPRWGKRRGDKGETKRNINSRSENGNGNVNGWQNRAPSPISSPIERNEELDYVDEEDDEEENDRGKKMKRKPVKARSLKSLM